LADVNDETLYKRVGRAYRFVIQNLSL